MVGCSTRIFFKIVKPFRAKAELGLMTPLASLSTIQPLRKHKVLKWRSFRAKRVGDSVQLRDQGIRENPSQVDVGRFRSVGDLGDDYRQPHPWVQVRY